LEIVDLYCGALSKVDRIFQIGSLPFQSGTPASAWQLLAAARSEYELRFAQHGVHLLYVSPWPPTGLWTREPIAHGSDFAGLRIRTYDDMSAAVVRLTGGEAQQMPISEAFEQLRLGSLDGVLSSGDGEAGQRLAEHLRYFHDVRYATPISFTIIGTELYQSMEESHRECLDTAAKAVESFLWHELSSRVLRNHASMLAAGVQVLADVPSPLKSAMRLSGYQVMQRWEQASHVDTLSILGGYFPSPHDR
jgi:TRAP-type C4-dicarboxylate transport system substrate-binding protein